MKVFIKYLSSMYKSMFYTQYESFLWKNKKSLQHQLYFGITHLCKFYSRILRDSNPQPPDPKSGALSSWAKDAANKNGNDRLSQRETLHYPRRWEA